MIPSLHIDYKGTRIKQYHKEGQALRTETTINNARDFYIGKSLANLPTLRKIGFQANRRVLEAQTIHARFDPGSNGPVWWRGNGYRHYAWLIPTCKRYGMPC